MRITAYADRLADDLDRVDWPEKVKIMQRNWIGRSQGARIHFPVGPPEGPVADIEVFTTRPDTVFGATFMVLAPEHPLVDQLVPDGGWPDGTKPEWTGDATTPREAVAAYRQSASRKSEVERQMEGQRQDRRLHRRHRSEPGQRRRDPGVHRGLRVVGLRHGRDHGASPVRTARLGVRDEVRPADRPHGAAAGGSSGRRGLPGRRSEHRLQQRRGGPQRPADRGRQGAHHRVARGQGLRSRHHQLPAARLAVQPAALLG